MTDRREARFTPNHRSAAQAASTTTTPRWFIREAVSAFGLSAFDIAVFLTIADNLDSHGISRTATSLIVDRAGISRSTAVQSLARLVDHGLIVEVDEKRSGAIMRYAIPRQRPWAPGELPV